jgi:iron complex outermembrane receptor protein
LLDLSLEELIDIDVTSVSMKEERWFTAPAAVHVVTGEDIRRSGVTSLAEALRLVPGMQVARYNSNEWAISARGFNDVWANKLLVLVDGRSVYNPLFAGVQWDIQDLVLEDVARIEVIRGPGATLWGANAVNGVINIVTKSSHETQGPLVSASAGTEDRVLGTARHGVTLRPGLTARGFAKYTRRDRLSDPFGSTETGEWDVARAGARADWRPSDRHHVMLDGAAYQGDVPEFQTVTSLTSPYQALVDTVASMSGGWVLSRWEHRAAKGSDVTVQAYFDRITRERATFRDVRETWDLEVRHRFTAGPMEVVWGTGYRHSTDHFTASFTLAFEPGDRQDNLWSFFVQNQLTLVPDRLALTAGTKLEHNTFSGFEAQPSVRMLWTPHPRHTVWASASRAVRTPARADHDVRYTAAAFPDSTGLVNVVQIRGNPEFRSEELLALEAGYRIRPARNLWVDLSAFFNQYDDLQTAMLGVPYVETAATPAYLVIPQLLVNGAEGSTHGVELLVHIQPLTRWRFTTSFSAIAMDISDQAADMPGADPDYITGRTPAYQGYVRSEFDLPKGLELDATLYAVDALPNQQVPAYTRLDARVGWRAYAGLTLSLGVQNALEARHAEFDATIGSPVAQVERSVVGRIAWRF